MALASDHIANPPTFMDVGTGAAARRIAFLKREGAGPTTVWLGGFRSDMRATKATEIDLWAEREGRPFLRFDYAGHGESGGDFEACTISSWLEDALAVIDAHGGERPVLVGSSMGGWMALLVTRELLRRDPGRGPGGLVLIAPAADFTEKLMWAGMSDDIRRTIEEEGVWYRPSEYAPEPYPITRALIHDGRRHLLMDGAIATNCPVHIVQGMQDPDVPWQHAMALVENLPGDAVTLTLVKEGDHRLSRPEDLARLVGMVDAMVKQSEAA